MRTARPFRRTVVAFAAAGLLLSGCSTDTRDRPDDLRSPSDRTASTVLPVLEALPEDINEDLQPYYEQRLSWRDCGVAGFQCATLAAPLDYDDVQPAEDVQLAVARVRATTPGERIGSLLVNPGGPGASAIDYLQGYAGTGFPQEVRARYDMVAMDPRGTGRSEPVECLTDEEMDEFTQVDRTPDNDREIEELVTAFEEFAQSCQERSGPLLEHISTVESARDLDLLRALLGDEQLHFYGASYGTYLGATYAGLFPSRVGRLVLDAGIDPRLTTLETDREQAGGFETAFRSFAEDCAGQPACPLGHDGPDEASERLRALFEQLDENPLPTKDDRPLTESLATSGVAQAMYSPHLWQNLRVALTAALDDSDGTQLLALSDAYHDREEDGSYGSIMFAFPAISCLDNPAALDTPQDVRGELASFEEASPTFGRDFAWATLLCAAWPVEPVGGPRSIEAEGAADILVIGTTRDPATPYAWSVGLAEQLESGVLLTYEGDGHGAYNASPCIDAAVGTYLLDGVTPEDGTTCD
ncbi:alpha/beta hydrolase [Streptomyces sp. ACA25]|uniref:alpha/beta hydrolase n=1 Tax=Streptomyces sp. ACA25 TaxID=3022596 RepID=UPI00230702BC|nr:alpha/beta hydrolase [Streptomyces sp. ACA25]MDB1086540.1 alpha/beta hydrolase [Streptomyces sp. ACA25]